MKMSSLTLLKRNANQNNKAEGLYLTKEANLSLNNTKFCERKIKQIYCRALLVAFSRSHVRIIEQCAEKAIKILHTF